MLVQAGLGAFVPGGIEPSLIGWGGGKECATAAVTDRSVTDYSLAIAQVALALLVYRVCLGGHVEGSEGLYSPHQ
jgi:hypothetical protein